VCSSDLPKTPKPQNPTSLISISKMVKKTSAKATPTQINTHVKKQITK